MGSERKGSPADRVAKSFDIRGNRASRLKLDEPPEENASLARAPKEDWALRHRDSLMESITMSLWSWLLVLAVCAWFSLWLLEALNRLGTRFP